MKPRSHVYGPIRPCYGPMQGPMALVQQIYCCYGPTGLLPTAARAVGPGPVGLGPQLAASRRAVKEGIQRSVIGIIQGKIGISKINLRIMDLDQYLEKMITNTIVI